MALLAAGLRSRSPGRPGQEVAVTTQLCNLDPSFLLESRPRCGQGTPWSGFGRGPSVLGRQPTDAALAAAAGPLGGGFPTRSPSM